MPAGNAPPSPPTRASRFRASSPVVRRGYRQSNGSRPFSGRLLHARFLRLRGITDLITVPGLVGLDFADVQTALRELGDIALMGEGKASGASRTRDAAMRAISCPLLVSIPIKAARGLLIKISMPPGCLLDEVGEAVSVIQENTHEAARIFFQAIPDGAAEGEMHITIIATGISLVKDSDVAENTFSRAAWEKPFRENEFTLDEDQLKLPAFVRRSDN